ncbi:MAG: TIGR04211 family SH3 domain-containing protein [Desulfobacula sp.]|nr:TIGR04211 family SH3 domain-containing protein [Desulfobacula sp.]
MKKKLLIGLILVIGFVSVSSSYAEDIYVTGITNITMRTGPGVGHKIVAMLKSGTKLEILQYEKDWSQVKTGSGKLGWVLSRFLTQKVPDALLVSKLERQTQNLREKLNRIEENNKNLTIQNAKLVQIEEKYNKLKKESSDFLKLDAKHKEVVKQYQEQKGRIEVLEDESKNEIKYWLLIGPGVFIVGLFLGLSTRKKKTSGLL